MPIFRKNEDAVLFIHVPKTGGTSIEDLFANSGWEVHYLDRAAPGTLNPYRRCSPQHMHGALLEATFQLGRFQLVFMMVREPIARFRSELLMQIPALQDPWNDELERKASALIRNYTANPFIADNHVRPQAQFYVPGAKVLRFEKGLDHVAETLRDSYSLDLDLSNSVPHAQKGGNGFPSSAINVPEHLRRDLFYFYREDFQRFGYDTPIGID